MDESDFQKKIEHLLGMVLALQATCRALIEMHPNKAAVITVMENAMRIIADDLNDPIQGATQQAIASTFDSLIGGAKSSS